ncbi:N-acetylglucosamine kinase [uncultured Clostridium sp.]|jgi:N-acetylglucosamine kinase-like BadF-type ATPase|uniref:N-acetylglucosamine kinase n=1 Tax=uncultured Clostridium sp. TaxID=59620 RepID=UPI00262C4374|nr:BadF/BadG/BcrA/BcrD ATPase family protein [uncultured Clostridium sp.]
MMYVIGVDGGGTKTETVAYDLEGNKLTSILTGFGNLVNGKDEALRNILDGIKQIFEKHGKDNVKGIYLGLAGSEVGFNADIVYESVKKEFSVESIVMNDSELALKALLRGEDGILAIAGTGSIAFGLNNGVQWKSGGWGHLLGDEGSAYKIAIEGLKHMIYENDNNMELGALSRELLTALEVEKVDDIIGFVYSSTKDEIAKLAQIVSKLAEKGDEKSLSIMVSEGELLGETTRQVFSKLGFESCSVGLVGGVVRKSKIFRDAYESYLREKVNIVSFIDDDVSPAKGAFYIYKKEVTLI